MLVELYEKIWMWIGAAIIVLFLGSILVPAVTMAIHPPSHIETIDPTALGEHPEFASGGVTTDSNGRTVVSVLAGMFAFSPDPIEVPANQPITFRITSGDVIHGFEVVGTNANAMAIPGYVSQFTVTFPKAGEYVIACHEYCGLLHHAMVGKLIVRGS
ncbi:MAG TPA: cytochrome c oxidase subunit II [Vicinamibacterales bacterium]|nr:cytochrome c oxidase subunit II [Vicinamibacterales bacterium]